MTRRLSFAEACVADMHALSQGQQEALGVGITRYVQGRLEPHSYLVRRRWWFVEVEAVQVDDYLWLLVRSIDDEQRVALRIVKGGKQEVSEMTLGAAQAPLGLPTVPVLAARRATNLAARVAGPQRAHLQREWTAVLAGSADDAAFSARQQVVLSLGFLFASIRMRARDIVSPAWRPVDWLLRSTSRTNGFIATAVGAQAVYIVGDGGLDALFTEIWEPCGIAGAGLYALSRWLRRIRGIELAGVEPDSTDE